MKVVLLLSIMLFSVTLTTLTKGEEVKDETGSTSTSDQIPDKPKYGDLVLGRTAHLPNGDPVKFIFVYGGPQNRPVDASQLVEAVKLFTSETSFVGVFRHHYR